MSIQNDTNSPGLPDHLCDGYFIHKEALSRGLQVLLLPRQVMLAGEKTSIPGNVAFTHGAPNASTLSAMTFAQDRRLRRALFERTSVPKPRGASFSWRSISRATKWAARIGYPVSVKETVGENPAVTIRNVQSKEELRDAFQALRRRHSSDRAPGSNPQLSGYATTRLTYTLDEAGNEVAPLRTRMLIEKEVPGTVIRSFVIDERVIAAVELDESRSTGMRDVTSTLKPELVNLLVRASQAIPGLACATIDVVLHRERGFFKKPKAFVVELSERPRMNTFATANVSLAESISASLIEYEAKLSDTRLLSRYSTMISDVSIEGLRHPKNTAEGLSVLFEEHGLTFSTNELDVVGGTIKASCSGSISLIARFMELLMAGLLLEDRASAIEYQNQVNHV